MIRDLDILVVLRLDSKSFLDREECFNRRNDIEDRDVCPGLCEAFSKGKTTAPSTTRN